MFVSEHHGSRRRHTPVVSFKLNSAEDSQSTPLEQLASSRGLVLPFRSVVLLYLCLAWCQS